MNNEVYDAMNEYAGQIGLGFPDTDTIDLMERDMLAAGKALVGIMTQDKTGVVKEILHQMVDAAYEKVAQDGYATMNPWNTEIPINALVKVSKDGEHFFDGVVVGYWQPGDSNDKELSYMVQYKHGVNNYLLSEIEVFEIADTPAARQHKIHRYNSDRFHIKGDAEDA